tara:strand:- start:1467 stop:2138 length:672 start_codon:yes stop_codon:yes gene_type:complete
MAFDYTKFQQSNGMGLDLNRVWVYTDATDPIATIEAAGYFNSVNELNPTPVIVIGDLIWVNASDASQFVEVTAVSPDITVVDQAGPGSGVVSVALSAADFNGMYAAPKLLLAAPGANKLITVTKAIFEVNYGTAQFANGGVFALQYDATVNGAGEGASATTAAAVAIGWAADSLLQVEGLLANSASALSVNKGIYLSNLTGAFDTGDSVMTIHLFYNVVETTV